MARDRIYKRTSIGRPLSPGYPTNRAVLLIMPFAGSVAAIQAGLRGAGPADMVIAGLVGVAVAFGSWALARELAPDDNPAAFIAMAFAFATFLVVETPSLLLLFASLFLVRIVNRTAGLPARISDSIIVAALTLWTMHVTRSPLLGAVGALAFAFDATLRDPLRRQRIFAGLCLGGAGLWVAQFGTGLDDSATPAGTIWWLVPIASILYAVSFLRTRSIESVGDVTGLTLSLARVRAGMLIGLLVPAQALALGALGPTLASLVWAVLAGVGIGSLSLRVLSVRSPRRRPPNPPTAFG